MGLDGAPDFIGGNTKLIAKLRACARRAGMYQTTRNDFGQQVEQYGSIPLVDLGAKPGTNDPIVPILDSGDTGCTSLYAVRFGLDGFHAVSPAGVCPVRQWLPDYRTAGAVKTGGVVDIYDEPVSKKRISFEPDKYNALLGTNVSKEDMLSYFKRLEVEYDEASNELIIPTFRQDLNRDADIAEEVARFFGYDNIPTTLPKGSTTMGKIPFERSIEDVAGEVAQFCGFSQAMTYSFESPKVFDKLKLAADSEYRKTVVISNPLGEDFSIMRTLPVNGMLTSLSTNYNRRNKNVKLYELAKVYLAADDVNELQDERVMFTLGAFGDVDFFQMKGVVEEFLERIGMRVKPEYNPEAGITFLHPGRQAEIIYDGTKIGYMGELHPDVADTYSLGDRTYIVVIDLSIVTKMASFDRKFEGIAKFPAVTRDISMVMPKSVLVGKIEKIIEKRGGSILESYKLFDIYEGAQIKEGYKSVAYSISFRAKDKTLEDKDITPVMEKIYKDLSDNGIELRM